MADENTTPADPFEGFVSTATRDGEPITPPKAGATKGEEPKGEAPKDEAPKGEAPKDQTVPHIEDDDDDDPLAAFSDPADDDDDQDDDDQDDDQDDDDQDDDDQDDEPAPKKNKVPFRKRIAQMTRARAAAEQEAAALRARVVELESINKPADNKDNKPAKKSDDGKNFVPTGDDGEPLVKPDPKKYAYGEVDPEYLDDVINYGVDVRMAKQRHADATRQAEAAETEKVQKLRQRWGTIEETGLEAYDDFEKVVLGPAARGEFPMTKDMAEIISESDQAADIMYHLARNQREAVKVSEMGQIPLARYIGRLEAAIQTRDKQRDKGMKRQPKAAPPPSRRQPRGAGGKYASLGASSDFAAFEQQAMAATNKTDRKR